MVVGGGEGVIVILSVVEIGLGVGMGVGGGAQDVTRVLFVITDAADDVSGE